MNLSIVIPTYNEATNIEQLLYHLFKIKNSSIEVIVSDGGSEDDTIAIAKNAGAIAALSPGKGRAAQMNYGASMAKGDVLYFIHADCFPPFTFINDIQQAITEGYQLGRYRTKFNSKKGLLKINAWFTQFDLFVCMGGDQTIFIKRALFEQCSGFNEDMKIMEEYEFCERARKIGKYKILKGYALISARKYDTNSWLKVQRANMRIMKMYKKGLSQQEMVDEYQRLLNYRTNSFDSK